MHQTVQMKTGALWQGWGQGAFLTLGGAVRQASTRSGCEGKSSFVRASLTFMNRRHT